MHRQSHAYQRLVALYRGLIASLRASQREAYLGFLRQIPMRLHVEMLQPRILMSVTPSAPELPPDAKFAPAVVVSPNNTVAASQTTLENTSLIFSSAHGNAISVSSSWNYVELQSTHGTLTLATKSGLNFSIGGGTNNTDMKFGGTTAAMNAALNGLIYSPTTGYTGSAAVSVTTSTSGLLGLGLLATSSTSNIAITITAPPPPVNVAPTIRVPGTQTTSEGTAFNFDDGQTISVSDLDNDGNVEQVTLAAANGTITLGELSNLTIVTGTGTSDQTVTFKGKISDLNNALSDFTFTPASLFYGTAGVTATIDDLGNSGTGGAKTAAATVSIDVTQVNQPPTVSLPGAQTGAENGQLIFSTSNGNAISVTDSDSGGGAEQLTLSTNIGTLSLATTSGLTFVSGANGSAGVTVSGTLVALNAALNGLTLTPSTGYSGAATLSVNIDDLGQSGSGGDKNVSGSIAINYVSSLIVTTANDVVDGTTTSISALLNNPGTDGKISLREAIEAANNTPGLHQISFDIASSGVQTITVGSALPQINNSVIIDATTEPGYAGTPLIELNGQSAAFGAIGLAIAASNCTVRGLAVCGFSGNGIDVLPVGANNITLQGNYVGVDAAGAAIFNGVGIVLANSSNDLVGGTTAALRNVISGNYSYGVEIFGSGSSSDVIAGNYIGVNPAGTAAVANGSVGVFVNGASGNVIGLATAGGGNLISGNGTYGIEVGGTSPSANVIQGNIIGLNAVGTGGLSNGSDGIYLNAATSTLIGGPALAARNIISGNTNAANTADGIWIDAGSDNTIQGNIIGLDITGNAAHGNYAAGIMIQDSPGNVIGGISAGDANIISGNGSYGLEISGLAATNNVVQGNDVGTNETGSAGIANGNDGIFLNNTTGNTIGGTSAGAGNLISGNTNVANLADGIWIDSGSANLVQGNRIGTDAAGTGSLGNYHDGINITASSNNVIGGIAAGAGNIIAYNAKGVVVMGSGAIGNAIRGNSVFANITLGLDLGDDGITANTGAVSSSLPNNGMNFPVLTTLALTGTTLAVNGYVGSAANEWAFAGATIDLFKSDQSGSHGQGQIYLGSLTTNGSGNFSGTLTITGVAVGDQLTATATDASGNTSEFAANVTVQLVNAPPLIAPLGDQNVGENAIILFSPSRGNAVTVSDPDANGGIEEVTLSVSSGILTLSGTAGLVFQNSTSNGSSMLDFTGTLNDIDAALDGLTYSPPQDFAGTSTLVINANDLGHTGAGGAQTDSANVNLNVTAVAHSPTVSNASTTMNTQSSGGLVITADPLDGNAQGYYQITQIAGGSLFLNDGLTPIADGQFITFAEGAAGLKFTPAANSTAVGGFEVQASSGASGGLVGSPVAATITVIDSITPSVSDASTTENQQSAGGLVITPNALDLATSIWFQITNIQGGELFLNDGTTAVAEGDFITAGQGEAGLKFTPSANSTAAGGFDVQASSSGDVSGLAGNAVSATITVVPVPPVNSAPANQAGQQDTSIVFSAANQNAIAISDPGSNGADEQVTLTATHGTLTLASTMGITLVSGTGTADTSVTLDGSLAGINAALNGLTFMPASHYNGAAAIAIVTQDLSPGNAGASLQASSAIVISLAPAVVLPNTPPLPVETNLPQTPPPQFSPAPMPPISSFPVIDNTPAPSTATVDPISDQSAAVDNTATTNSAPAQPSTTDEKSRAAAAILPPMATAVAPVLPRGLATKAGEGDVVSLPEIPRLNDLAVPTNGAIALSPVQRLAMELGNPGAEGVIRTGAMLLPTRHGAMNLAGNSANTLAANSSLWRDLDRMEEKMTSEHRMHVVAGAASLVSVGMSVMYFMWAVRAGSVLSSLLSSMPAWKLVDPLPILDQMAGSRAGRRAREKEEDGETLESMVEGNPGG